MGSSNKQKNMAYKTAGSLRVKKLCDDDETNLRWAANIYKIDVVSEQVMKTNR